MTTEDTESTERQGRNQMRAVARLDKTRLRWLPESGQKHEVLKASCLRVAA
jgi:hypothetical protein